MVTVEDQKLQKYYFNIPDVTQRFAKDHGLGFSKRSRIFFTEMSPAHIGGLLGLLCTMSAQSRSEETCLYGAGIVAFMESSRYLMQLNMNLISCFDFVSKQQITGFQSNEDLLKHFVNSDTYTQKQQYNFEEFAQTTNIKSNQAKQQIVNDNQYCDENITITPIISINQKGKYNVGYILRSKQISGKVIKEKLKELNIPPKLLGKFLKEGFLILEDGRTITADLVREPDQPSQIIIILDISDEQVLHRVVTNKLFENLLNELDSSTDKISLTISCLVTIADSDIIESTQFRELILTRLAPQQHLIVNKNQVEEAISQEDYHFIECALRERSKTSIKLNEEYSSYFPNILQNSLINRFKHSSDINQINSSQQVACPFKEYVVYPFKSRGYNIISSISQKISYKKQQGQYVQIEKEKNINSSNEFVSEQINQLDKNLQKLTLSDKIQSNNDSSISFLGTGCMLPLPFRTVSGILIKNESSNVLLDCGEGTYGQIIFQYGVEITESILRNLRIVFISHIHLDHCAGLFELLQRRDELQEQYDHLQDVYIIIPINLAPLVRGFHQFSYQFSKLNKFIICNDLMKIKDVDYSQSEEIRENQNLCENVHDYDKYQDKFFLDKDIPLKPYEHPRQQEIIDNCFNSSFRNALDFQQLILSKQLGILQFDICEVIHCGESFGVAINFQQKQQTTDSFKISYSGDTRPCNKFEEIAQFSDVFIHECTFADDLQKNAEENNHTTISEAISSAKNARAKTLVLTHFSQRYTSININEYKGDIEFLTNNTIVAFDHFEARFKDFTNNSKILSTITQKFQMLLNQDAEQ